MMKKRRLLLEEDHPCGASVAGRSGIGRTGGYGTVTGGRALITVGIRRNCDESKMAATCFLPPAQDPSLWEGRWFLV